MPQSTERVLDCKASDNVYLHKELYDDAIDHYRRSIALNPNYLWSHNNLGWALALEGKLDVPQLDAGHVPLVERGTSILALYPRGFHLLEYLLPRPECRNRSCGH